MGKRRGKKFHNRSTKRRRIQNANASTDNRTGRKTWTFVEKVNAEFETYYKGIGLVSDEEWEEFMDTLRIPLPTTFRVNEVGLYANILKDKLENHFVPSLPTELSDELLAQITNTHNSKQPNADDNEDGNNKNNSDSNNDTKDEINNKDEKKMEDDNNDGDKKEDDANGNDNTNSKKSPLLIEKYEPLRTIAWYPNNLGWHFTASRGMLKKDANLKQFHEFLKAQTEQGGISRQEAVSMIPPLFLDVQPHHKVLDMCAAPGSKTAQILEKMHCPSDPNTPVTGCVVANDLDDKRCYMLVHQVKRINSPNIMITNHEAQKFPMVPKRPVSPAEAYKKECDDRVAKKEVYGFDPFEKPVEGEFVRFDRVLADVPCCGDGTLRKNFDLWGRWTPNLGQGLHKIQVQIAFRGVQLLQVGGRIVYSTCTFNPVEDEAVVCELLRICKGSLEIEDVSTSLPQLKRRPGMATWKVRDQGAWIDTYEDVPAARRGKVLATMFPPTKEEAEWMHLERCVRVFPHLQNTGGFFITVLKKTGEVSDTFIDNNAPKKTKKESNINNNNNSTSNNDKKEAKETATETVTETVTETATETATEAKTEATASDNSNKKKNKVIPEYLAKFSKQDIVDKQRLRFNKFRSNEAPFIKLSHPDWAPILQNIKEFYGLKEDFPMHQLLVRSDTVAPKHIYYIGPSLSNVVHNDARKWVKAVNMGLRTFAKHTQDGIPCPYRLVFEGVKVLLPFMSKRRQVDITEKEFVLLLTQRDPFFSSFSDASHATLKAMDIGGVVLNVDLSSKKLGVLHYSAWRGKVSVHLLLDKNEKKCAQQLFNIDGTFGSQNKATEAQNKANAKVKKTKTVEKKETETEAKATTNTNGNSTSTSSNNDEAKTSNT